MAADFQIPKGARLPLLTATLSDANGAINLAGMTVKFRMRTPGSSVLKVDTDASVTAASSGQVSYAWALADTDTPGLYIGWFQITVTADGTIFDAPEPPLVIEITRGAG